MRLHTTLASVSYCKQLVIKTQLFCMFKNLTRDKMLLLSVSCPSANEFSAIFLSHLAQSSSNSPRLSEGFRQTLRRNFIQIRQRVKNFPIDPHCKHRTFSATSCCRKRAMFTMGVYVEILHMVSNPIEILFQSLSKTFKLLR